MIDPKTLKQPRPSVWKCRLFGTDAVIYVPPEGKEPIWFWRKMQYIFFGFTWTKEQD